MSPSSRSSSICHVSESDSAVVKNYWRTSLFPPTPLFASRIFSPTLLRKKLISKASSREIPRNRRFLDKRVSSVKNLYSLRHIPVEPTMGENVSWILTVHTPRAQLIISQMSSTFKNQNILFFTPDISKITLKDPKMRWLKNISHWLTDSTDSLKSRDASASKTEMSE